MIFNHQNRSCHPERSEGSAHRETLRYAQGDNTLPILVVKVHYRAVSEGSSGARYKERRALPSRIEIEM